MINASFVWDIYQKYKDIFSGGAVKKGPAENASLFLT